MALMSLTHLVNEAEDPYIKLANETVRTRYTALMNALNLPADNGSNNAQYYALVDVMRIIKERYDGKFAEWVGQTRTEVDFLNDLAEKKGVVLMYGPGFNAPAGTVRISLANLNEDDYVEIARRLFELLDDYHAEYETQSQLDKAA